MSAPTFNLDIQTIAPASVRVFRLNDYEWWAGESLQDCISAAGELWGFQGEELAEQTEDAYELSDEDLDTTTLRADEEGDIKLTFREALDAMCVAETCFPRFFAGTE